MFEIFTVVDNEYTTSDLSLAAFLVMRGLQLVSATREHGKFKFSFKDPTDVADSLSIEYINSEFSKYDNHVRSLKKILYKN